MPRDVQALEAQALAELQAIDNDPDAADKERIKAAKKRVDECAYQVRVAEASLTRAQEDYNALLVELAGNEEE